MSGHPNTSRNATHVTSWVEGWLEPPRRPEPHPLLRFQPLPSPGATRQREWEDATIREYEHMSTMKKGMPRLSPFARMLRDKREKLDPHATLREFCAARGL